MFSFAMGMPCEQTLREGVARSALEGQLRQEVATKGLYGGSAPVVSGDQRAKARGTGS